MTLVEVKVVTVSTTLKPISMLSGERRPKRNRHRIRGSGYRRAGAGLKLEIDRSFRRSDGWGWSLLNVSGTIERTHKWQPKRTTGTVYAVSVMFEVAVYRVDVAALLSAQRT